MNIFSKKYMYMIKLDNRRIFALILMKMLMSFDIPIGTIFTVITFFTDVWHDNLPFVYAIKKNKCVPHTKADTINQIMD